MTDASAQPVITRALGAPGPTALGVTRDGSLAAVGHADDGSVHLYGARPGRAFEPLGTIAGPGKGAQVFALAFSPDGRVLAAGGERHDVQLWDVHDPAHPRALATLATGFAGAVESIAFRPDGTALAAGSGGPHPVVTFDVTDPAHPGPRVSPRVPKGFVLAQSVAFSPDGAWLAAGGTGGTVLWPTRNAAGAVPTYAQAATNPAQVNAVAFAPHGDLLYAGDQAGTVRAWSVGAKPAAVHTWTGTNNSQINAVAVAPDGSRVAAGRSDDSLQLFTPELAVAGAPLHNPGPVTGVSYAGRTLFWTAADGTLRGEPAGDAAIPVAGTVFNLGYSKDGSRLAIVRNGDGAGIQLWDARHPSAPRLLGPTLTLPQKVDGSGGMNSTGTLVAGGTADGHVALWDTRDPAHPRLLGAPFAAAGALVESIAFSPDDSVMGVASDDGTLSLWSVTDPAHPRRLGTMRRTSFMLSLAFSPDGHLVAGANGDGTGDVWDVTNPARPVLRAALGGFRSYVYGVAFSPDGRRLAVSSADHTVRLFDTSRPAAIRPVGTRLIGATDYVYSVVFSPDGATLATASNDGAVRLYDVRHPDRRAPLQTLRSLGGPVFIVAFSPDGATLVGAGRPNVVATWSLDPSAYARRLCAGAGDPITRDEWSVYVPGAAYAPPCRSDHS